MTKIAGSPETQRFYDETGWKEQDGNSIDHNLFGVKEEGPIRVGLHRLHSGRIRAALLNAGTPLNFLECGCGGNPASEFLDLCSSYTGVDFSDAGIQMARSSFADVKIPHEFRVADICALPFADGTFDAVFSAHTTYHIEDPKGQHAAIAEFIRVVRPGGVVVLIAANPRPLASPTRLAKRLTADLPFAGSILNRFRARPPLPYKPMTIGWMRERLARGGPVEVLVADIPSNDFHRNVTEFRGAGKLLWKGIHWLDANYPKLSAHLGNYVMLSCRKSG